ncbi:hypothetical protein GGR52DRAFT_588082 [Hypoxylon sp. FL1284]|nr:hypothetical protein GGR52DRAFT_588082 [Hypoxylon sp. FL1284]
MSRTPALGALCASNGAFETASRRIVSSTQRTFSSTAQRNASIPTFTPTSSPQLDELLSEIRRKIILPSYLPAEQRRRIASPRFEKRLQTDPVIIEVDGEVFRFRYQDPLRTTPVARRVVAAAVARFRTADDFANLRPLLEGMVAARRRLPDALATKILRLAGERGRVLDALECARGVARTGLRLDASEKAAELLHALQMQAAAADFAHEDTARALRRAEMVVDLLQEDGHQPPRRHGRDPQLVPGELPLYRDPLVLLAPLHLAAVLVARYPDEAAAAEPAAKLAKYARDVVRLWPEGKKLTEVQPPELYEDPDRMGYLRDPSKFVTVAAPLLHGLNAAVDVVVDSELAAQLQARRDLLAAEVAEARKKKPEGRGEAVYQKLFGDAA